MSEEKAKQLRRVIQTGEEASSIALGPEPSEDDLTQVGDEQDAQKLFAQQKVQREQIVTQHAQHILDEAKKISAARHWYAGILCAVTIIWVVAVFAVLGLQGFHYQSFWLSDPVIIAFLTTTTANVLGLFYLVTRWLYGEAKKGTNENGKAGKAHRITDL